MVADSIAKILYSLFQKLLHLPQALAAANVVQKIAENPAAVGGVADFGGKLQTIDRPCPMAHGGDRTGISGSQGDEFPVHSLNLIAMAHPHDSLVRNAGK